MQAFPAACELLGEVLDRCPDAWVPGLHSPLMRLAHIAVGLAGSNSRGPGSKLGAAGPVAAEALTRVSKTSSVHLVL
jgi:hypothetical protein